MSLLTDGSIGESITVDYTYDSAGRLVQADYNGPRIEFTYDPAGNLLRRTQSSGVDSDKDGMDDGWEEHHFKTLERDGMLDYDLDGMIDVAEFLAGTLPDDSTSLLRVESNPKSEPGRVVISWDAVPGKSYRVEFKDSLRNPAWTPLAGDVTAYGATASKSDSDAAGVADRFYRVRLLP